MPELSWLIVIIGSLGNLIIGLTTYLKTPKSATSKWFVIFSFLFAAYLITNQLSTIQTNDTSTLLWIRVVMVIAPAIVFSFFMLVNAFPKPDLQISKKVFIGSLFATIAIMILDSTSLVFVDVMPGTNQPIPGKLVFLFILYNIFFLSWSIYLLINKYRKASGIEKTQLKYFLFGAIAMFSLILFSNIFLVVFFGISSLVVFVPIYTLIFVGLVSYAIVRHSLFDIKVIATQAFTVVLWIVLFAKVFISDNASERIVDSIILLATVIFGALLIRTVSREVEQRSQLETLNKKLQELDDRKDEFISIAAHELRAPMTAIKGYLSMIAEGDAGKVPEKVSEFLDSATLANDRLVRLVNNMLNVSRIEEGRTVFQMGNVKLIDVAKESFESFKEQAKERGLEFTIEIPENVQSKVYVDQDRIHEVATNLVSNAIKYTDSGSVTIRLTNPSPSSVRFEVIDTGPGLGAEEQSKLFQKFYRAESNAGKAMGTGLGLYISKLLIEKFGGTINIISSKGKGSTFWFELPLVR